MADSLSRILNSTEPPATEADSDAEAVSIGDMEGKAPRPANKVLTRLHVVLKDGSVHTFVYHHLDSNATFNGNSFTLVFVGAKHWQVQVKGRGKEFWRAFDYITLFRWPYLREATRDFGDGLTFSEIRITDVTPRPEAG